MHNHCVDSGPEKRCDFNFCTVTIERILIVGRRFSRPVTLHETVEKVYFRGGFLPEALYGRNLQILLQLILVIGSQYSLIKYLLRPRKY